MVGAGSAIFWILGNKNNKGKKLYNCFVCLGASVFVIVLHAVFHQTPNQDAFGLQMEEV
jgi:hypothetical protein